MTLSNYTTLYWREGDELKYGAMDDLFLSYSRSTNKEDFYVLSGYRRTGANWNQFLSQDTGKFSINTVEIGWSSYNVVYHNIRPVWRVTLRNGKTIEVTKDLSLFTEVGEECCLVDRPLDQHKRYKQKSWL